MILIADSGSTKSDWVLLDDKYEILNRFKTIGFNPYFLKGSLIENILKRDPQFEDVRKKVTQIYFYGAGCSNDYFKEIIASALKVVFTKAKITVDHDLTACAFACYDNEPAICGILGTGSNSCFFDGTSITMGHPSMGFILGDEGSGNYFGKRLIKKYFYSQLPKDLHDEFEAEFGLTHLQMSKSVYESDYSNVFLAGFMKFISQRRDHPFFQPILRKGFKKFIVNHILCYPQYKEVPTHFVGSIAHHFHDILSEVAVNHGVKMGKVIQKPLDAVVAYHKKHGYTETPTQRIKSLATK